MSKKRIHVLTCGGTITMKANASGALSPFYSGSDIINKIPRLDELATYTIEEVTNIDSSNMDTAIWTTLVQSILKHTSSCDAFLITHGTDTMAYTASALSFALHDFPKPIVFTGSQKPLDEIATDAINNVTNAVLVALKGHKGVSIVFGTKILQGNRATKISESSLEAFDSPMVAPLGLVEATMRIQQSVQSRIDGMYKGIYFDPAIMVIQLTPGIDSAHLAALLPVSHGFILEAYGPGNIPQRLLPFLHAAMEKNIPAVILSQSRRGITKMQMYEVGKDALDAGAIPGHDMTVEAAATKLMWIRKQTDDLEKIRKAFATSIAGEITLPDTL